MRIGLIGPNGYIGSAIASYFNDHGVNWTPLTRARIKDGKPNHLISVFRGLQLTAIINCAGYTGYPNVDACNLNRGACLAANVILPVRISLACKRLDLPWVSVSSGCIFNGYKSGGWTEKDHPNFTFDQDLHSFYTGSKWLGEQLIQCSKCYSVRVRMPFDSQSSPRNYITKLLTYPLLLNVRNSFTDREELPYWVWALLNSKAPYGPYHATNPGSLTAEEATKLLKKHGPKLHHRFHFTGNLQQPLATEPRSSAVLNSDKLQGVIGRIDSVERAFIRACKNYRE